MTEAVRFQELGHAYHPGNWVFRNYSAVIPSGSVVALLGPNGRGKTTLLKILVGAFAPTEGSVERHGRIAFVPQLFQVSFDYSVLDVVLMGRARHVGLFAQPSLRDESVAWTALSRFGLDALASRPFSELSGGQRQLAVFARALVAEADILVLDEPASALDFKNQQLVFDWIERLVHEDGLSVVFTTHYPNHALMVADSVLLMGEGTLVAGSADSVLSEEHLGALYGVPLRRVAYEHNGTTAETLTPVYPAKHLRPRGGRSAIDSPEDPPNSPRTL